MIYTDKTKKALKLCFEAHKEQRDKSGLPYVFHPFHLAEQMQTEETTVVALLHDVIEDSDITADDLVKEGFEYAIVNRVVRMTRKEGESYMDYIKRIGEDNICRIVKMCDLKDNMDITRLEKVTDKDFDRLKKYHKAYKYLKSLE